jgi:hypothetical protein
MFVKSPPTYPNAVYAKTTTASSIFSPYVVFRKHENEQYNQIANQKYAFRSPYLTANTYHHV